MKKQIEAAIQAFQHGTTPDNALALFKTLGYNTERQNRLTDKTLAGFNATFPILDAVKAKTADWKSVDLLFQLTVDEMSQQHSVFNTDQVDNTLIESYLFFALELGGQALLDSGGQALPDSQAEPDLQYTRTELANIARAFNKIFPMPVLLLVKHGDRLTLAVVHRRLNKQNADKDVLEKVTLIKDIHTQNPHRAHIEILHDLSIEKLRDSHHFTNFVELHKAWQKNLDTNALNKRFYKELSNWYFWASKHVYFPDAEAEALKGSVFADPEKVHEHNAKNLIRLLTRLLFVWFIKEKHLIPDELFKENWLKNQLKHFNPQVTTLATQGNESHYYRAVLQNLFFATLNQTRGKREFRKDGQHRNITNLLRYKNYFNDPDAFVNLLEAVVPFMNGGLFECLDKVVPDKKGKQGGDVIAYGDGFSDRADNLLKVPDFIFFGTHKHIDLSAELGSKSKSVEIKGLIDLLMLRSP